MSLRVAIVADDLTGALDTATPFALCGLRVAVAVGIEALDEALATGADVVAVNTASRALPASEAARRVEQVAKRLRPANPEIAFKKIDSRLKGNVTAESAAFAEALGRTRLMVAPAVPDQQRITIGGNVSGRGVDAPIAIAPLFAELEAEIADADADADLDRIVTATDWARTVAVGARGLGLAFARRFGTPHQAAFIPDAQTLIAIGSRDPITAQQIHALLGNHAHVTTAEAHLGDLEGAVVGALPAVLHCTGSYAGPDEAVSARFAAGVVRTVHQLRPSTLVMSGGDTALAILQRLDAAVLFPIGEAAPGMPCFTIETNAGHSIRCVVKSGGFGDRNALSSLIAAAAGAAATERRHA